ncbi:hypothetical protein, partial [Streptomyces sp. NPDC002082]|uniref:hypothetical protein n=1 Tax=Streptomyces sp. NPDC002082 TaxID=3154772 RepID=UPI00332EFA79
MIADHVTLADHTLEDIGVLDHVVTQRKERRWYAFTGQQVQFAGESPGGQNPPGTRADVPVSASTAT